MEMERNAKMKLICFYLPFEFYAFLFAIKKFKLFFAC